MDDPMAIVPYYDPFAENPSTESIFMFDEMPEPGLAELLSFDEQVQPNSSDPSILQSNDEILDTDDPFEDPFVLDMFNSIINENQPSEENIPGGEENNAQPQNAEFGNPIKISVWPMPQVPYTCTCCHVLREITHTNGNHMTKLEIHGRIGIICHAILENHYGFDGSNQNKGYLMFDFCKKSIESVKQFLMQYCEEREQAGYIMLQDPLMIFYEALCIGLNNGNDNLDTDDFLQPSPTDSGQWQQNQSEPLYQTDIGSDNVTLPRSSLAAQRERTGKLTVKDFINYFNLPIDEAAKRMNICPTVVKKICRRDGLLRWPYRKIKSIERKISTRRASLNAEDAEERASAQADIQRLQHELSNIFAIFRE